MHRATTVVRAGLNPATDGDPFMAGPVFAAPYHLRGDPQRSAFTYGRYANPTWTAYESALAELECGPCLAFGSGMAAVAAVLCSTLRPGDTVIIPSDGYFTTRELARGYLAPMGVRVLEVPTAGACESDELPGCRLVLLETPSNRGLDICDLRASIGAAHSRGAMVAVDNTTATVVGQQPLTLGADFSIASDTKGLAGHSDLLLGHVAVRDETLLAPLQSWRMQVGAIPGPLETWLAHRSLATLDVRLERQSNTALLVAQMLASHPAVAGCRYPGLPSDPSHSVARRQMRYFGAVVNFTLRDEATAERWLAAVKLVIPATSFGGIHSSAERRARWGGDSVPPGFIRLSLGIEDSGDLLEDIQHALETAQE